MSFFNKSRKVIPKTSIDGQVTNNTVTKVKPQDSNKMDDVNKKALKVITEKGLEEGARYMFTDQKTGKQRSYAEMRSLYG